MSKPEFGVSNQPLSPTGRLLPTGPGKFMRNTLAFFVCNVSPNRLDPIIQSVKCEKSNDVQVRMQTSYKSTRLH